MGVSSEQIWKKYKAYVAGVLATWEDHLKAYPDQICQIISKEVPKDLTHSTVLNQLFSGDWDDEDGEDES